MKLLTLNFLTCARKACKSSPTSFPLHPTDAELESLDVEYNSLLLKNILPRLEWEAIISICNELGLTGLPLQKPEPEDLIQRDEAMGDVEGGAVAALGSGEEEGEASELAKNMHRLLMETAVKEGKLNCGNCGHVYEVKEGIANFLLPAHLV